MSFNARDLGITVRKNGMWWEAIEPLPPCPTCRNEELWVDSFSGRVKCYVCRAWSTDTAKREATGDAGRVTK